MGDNYTAKHANTAVLQQVNDHYSLDGLPEHAKTFGDAIGQASFAYNAAHALITHSWMQELQKLFDEALWGFDEYITGWRSVSVYAPDHAPGQDGSNLGTDFLIKDGVLVGMVITFGLAGAALQAYRILEERKLALTSYAVEQLAKNEGIELNKPLKYGAPPQVNTASMSPGSRALAGRTWNIDSGVVSNPGTPIDQTRKETDHIIENAVANGAKEGKANKKEGTVSKKVASEVFSHAYYTLNQIVQDTNNDNIGALTDKMYQLALLATPENKNTISKEKIKELIFQQRGLQKAYSCLLDDPLAKFSKQELKKQLRTYVISKKVDDAIKKQQIVESILHSITIEFIIKNDRNWTSDKIYTDQEKKDFIKQLDKKTLKKIHATINDRLQNQIKLIIKKAEEETDGAIKEEKKFRKELVEKWKQQSQDPKKSPGEIKKEVNEQIRLFIEGQQSEIPSLMKKNYPHIAGYYQEYKVKYFRQGDQATYKCDPHLIENAIQENYKSLHDLVFSARDIAHRDHTKAVDIARANIVDLYNSMPKDDAPSKDVEFSLQYKDHGWGVDFNFFPDAEKGMHVPAATDENNILSPEGKTAEKRKKEEYYKSKPFFHADSATVKPAVKDEQADGEGKKDKTHVPRLTWVEKVTDQILETPFFKVARDGFWSFSEGSLIYWVFWFAALTFAGVGIASLTVGTFGLPLVIAAFAASFIIPGIFFTYKMHSRYQENLPPEEKTPPAPYLNQLKAVPDRKTASENAKEQDRRNRFANFKRTWFADRFLANERRKRKEQQTKNIHGLRYLRRLSNTSGNAGKIQENNHPPVNDSAYGDEYYGDEYSESDFNNLNEEFKTTRNIELKSQKDSPLSSPTRYKNKVNGIVDDLSSKINEENSLKSENLPPLINDLRNEGKRKGRIRRATIKTFMTMFAVTFFIGWLFQEVAVAAFSAGAYDIVSLSIIIGLTLTVAIFSAIHARVVEKRTIEEEEKRIEKNRLILAELEVERERRAGLEALAKAQANLIEQKKSILREKYQAQIQDRIDELDRVLEKNSLASEIREGCETERAELANVLETLSAKYEPLPALDEKQEVWRHLTFDVESKTSSKVKNVFKTIGGILYDFAGSAGTGSLFMRAWLSPGSFIPTVLGLTGFLTVFIAPYAFPVFALLGCAAAMIYGTYRIYTEYQARQVAKQQALLNDPASHVHAVKKTNKTLEKIIDAQKEELNELNKLNLSRPEKDKSYASEQEQKDARRCFGMFCPAPDTNERDRETLMFTPIQAPAC